MTADNRRLRLERLFLCIGLTESVSMVAWHSVYSLAEAGAAASYSVRGTNFSRRAVPQAVIRSRIWRNNPGGSRTMIESARIVQNGPHVGARPEKIVDFGYHDPRAGIIEPKASFGCRRDLNGLARNRRRCVRDWRDRDQLPAAPAGNVQIAPVPGLRAP